MVDQLFPSECFLFLASGRAISLGRANLIWVHSNLTVGVLVLPHGYYSQVWEVQGFSGLSTNTLPMSSFSSMAFSPIHLLKTLPWPDISLWVSSGHLQCKPAQTTSCFPACPLYTLPPARSLSSGDGNFVLPVAQLQPSRSFLLSLFL